MLIISCLSSGESGTTSWEVVLKRDVNGIVAFKGDTSTLDEELSTKKIFFNDGTDADSSLEDVRLGAICCSKETFSRGGLYARFVSAPIMRCAAARCERADMTCGELKAGFNGTYPNC